MINFGALPNGTTKSVAHNITNFGVCIGVSGYSTNGTNFIPLTWGGNAAGYATEINLTTTNLNIKCGANMSTYTTTYLTIEYTKS